MRREAIKAVVGFFCLGVLLGGLYLGLKYVIGGEEDSTAKARRNFLEERYREQPLAREDWPEDSGPEDALERPAPCPEVTVRGRVLDQHLTAASEQAFAARDGDDPVELLEEGGWLTCAAFKDATEVSLSLARREARAGPFPVGRSEGLVRFNWVVAESGTGLLSFLDVASVEIGSELRVYLRGRAGLPDGARLFATLGRGQCRWCGEELAVKDQGFRGLLAPVEKGFPSGRYTVKLEFNPIVQTPAGAAEGETDGTYDVNDECEEAAEPAEGCDPTGSVPDTGEAVPAQPGAAESPYAHPGVDETDTWASYEPCEVSLEIYVGDPVEEDPKRQEELAEYRSVMREARDLQREYLTLRSLALAAKGVPQALVEKAERQLSEGASLIVRSGRLNIPAWRSWLDTHFYPHIDRLIAIVARREAPTYVEIHLLVDAYVNELKRLFQIGSQRAYSASWFPPDPRDMCRISLYLEDEEAEVMAKLLHPRKGLQVAITRKIAAGFGELRDREPEEYELPIR